jgi:hypothetical protein
MLKKNYRKAVAAGVAAILAGAILFSPLLCGMTCLELGGIRANTISETVPPPAGEFVEEILESGAVGCALGHMVLTLELRDLAYLARIGSWVWIGVEMARFAEGKLWM